jgi:hypothetical protein
MVQLKVDETVFGKIKENIELINDQGKVLGTFSPAISPEEELRRKAFADYESGDYQKRKAISEGQEKYTTEQVLEHLRSLGSV